jgi:hypothetical protein
MLLYHSHTSHNRRFQTKYPTNSPHFRAICQYFCCCNIRSSIVIETSAREVNIPDDVYLPNYLWSVFFFQSTRRCHVYEKGSCTSYRIMRISKCTKMVHYIIILLFVESFCSVKMLCLPVLCQPYFHHCVLCCTVWSSCYGRPFLLMSFLLPQK